MITSNFWSDSGFQLQNWNFIVEKRKTNLTTKLNKLLAMERNPPHSKKERHDFLPSPRSKETQIEERPKHFPFSRECKKMVSSPTKTGAKFFSFRRGQKRTFFSFLVEMIRSSLHRKRNLALSHSEKGRVDSLRFPLRWVSFSSFGKIGQSSDVHSKKGEIFISWQELEFSHSGKKRHDFLLFSREKRTSISFHEEWNEVILIKKINDLFLLL